MQGHLAQRGGGDHQGGCGGGARAERARAQGAGPERPGGSQLRALQDVSLGSRLVMNLIYRWARMVLDWVGMVLRGAAHSSEAEANYVLSKM